ncbi:hypothetical protein ACMA5I_09435 [Paracoccaceae bacterium GXU_MW_L88]
MSYQSTIVSLDETITKAVDAFAADKGFGFNAYALKMERIGELRRLFSKTDAQLAELSLTRDAITGHVFSDIAA